MLWDAGIMFLRKKFYVVTKKDMCETIIMCVLDVLSAFYNKKVEICQFLLKM